MKDYLNEFFQGQISANNSIFFSKALSYQCTWLYQMYIPLRQNWPTTTRHIWVNIYEKKKKQKRPCLWHTWDTLIMHLYNVQINSTMQSCTSTTNLFLYMVLSEFQLCYRPRDHLIFINYLIKLKSKRLLTNHFF